MSSPYAILGDRPVDQLKVTELREELKRRKLTTRGLKEDLVKRLDEAVKVEQESAKKAAEGNDLSRLPSEEAKEEFQSGLDSADAPIGIIENIASTGEKGVSANGVSSVEATVVEIDEIQAKVVAAVDGTILKNETVESEKPSGVMHIDEVPTVLPDCEGLPSSDKGAIKTEDEICPKTLMDNDDLKSTQLDSSIQLKTYQVSVVDSDSGYEVTSNSVATAPNSVIEKNELNINIITGNKQLELDAKAEIVRSSPSSVVPDSVDVHDNMNDAEIGTGIDIEDVGSEKLNLNPSLGDDSVEEDVLNMKKVDAEPGLTKAINCHIPNQLEDDHVDVVGHHNAIETDTSNADGMADSEAPKRKLLEPTLNDEPVKKARRWNTGDLQSSELQSRNALPVTPPKGLAGSSNKSFSGFDTEQPKERIVPLSSKPPTNSLRIDRFLRPFTNKAVQELLGRTGTVTRFWMDQIKTHCYVSYSSVEEAEKTRDAVYNLQWPPNGGRLLVADFVDPQEVNSRLEATPSPTTTNITPTYQPHPHSLPKPTQLPVAPRQQPSLSSVPPVSSREGPHPSREHSVREHSLPSSDHLKLPPPPPLPEKADPPILTLDDFFRKTKSSPRIYYLPLSDEQVAVKIRDSGKNTTLHR